MDSATNYSRVFIRWFSMLVVGVVICAFLLPVEAQITVRPDRPRVFFDSLRVDQIRNAPRPALPDAGTLSLRVYPFAHPDQAFCDDIDNRNKLTCNFPIFDGFGRDRDHFFFRHTDPATNGDQLGFQVAFQSKNLAQYITSYSFPLPKETWSTVKIEWDSDNHTTSVQINDDTPLVKAWRNDAEGNPAAWFPTEPNFVMSGRLLLDDVKLESSIGEVLADFQMEDGQGVVISDLSNTTDGAALNTSNAWDSDPDNSANGVVRMDGVSTRAEVFGDGLADARVDLLKTASSNADKLNTGQIAADVIEDHPFKIVDVARSVGLAYLLSGNPEQDSYLQAALVYAGQLIEADPEAGPAIFNSADSQQAGRVGAMGLLYDWLYDVMSVTVYPNDPDMRTYADMFALRIMQTTKLLERYLCGTGNSLNVTQQTDGSLVGSWTCATWPPTPSLVGGHDHQNDTEILAGVLAIITEYPELNDLLDLIHYDFFQGFNAVRSWVAVDGGHHMGWDYGATYTFQDSTQLFDIATDVDLKAPWQTQLVDRYLYGLRSDLVYPASGDAFRGRISLNNQNVAGFALIASKRAGNPYAQEFYDRTIRPYTRGSRFEELMYWTPGQATANLSELPTSKWFRNSGQVLMRDSFDYANASLVEFKSTSFWTENHHHLDQNAFTLYYKAPLLLDSGFYDSYNTEHWREYFTRTVAHNTLTVWDPSEQFVRRGAPFSNDGGQQFTLDQSLNPKDVGSIMEGGNNHLDGVVSYEYGSDYTYTVGNASKAYIDQKTSTGNLPTKLDSEKGFLRHLVFLKSPSFWTHPIVVDYDAVTVIPGKEALDKSVLWHMVNEPVYLDGSGHGPGIHSDLACSDPLRISNGGGMVLLQTLLPVNCKMTKIGGQDKTGDYRFMVRDSEAGTYTNYPPNRSDFHADVGEWRVEATATDSKLSEHFLSVISIADDNPTTLPPAANAIDSPTVAGVLLGNQLSVVFRKPDVSATEIYWQQSVAGSEALITGLAPSSEYSINQVPLNLQTNLIRVSKEMGGTNVSSANGVIRLAFAPALGKGVFTSRNVDFSTSDTLFNSLESLQVLVWNDVLDVNNIKSGNGKFTLRVNGTNYTGTLVNQFNKTYLGALALGPEHVGSATLTIEVKEKGRNAQFYTPAPISLMIIEPGGNVPPTASITTPADGASFASGELISFSGSANDTEDGDLTASITWNSSIDGDFGTGGNVNWAPVSNGSHSITARVIDSGGKTGTSKPVNITVGTVACSIYVDKNSCNADAACRWGGGRVKSCSAR